MWKISFISRNYKYTFFSIFSHFSSYLISLHTSKVNVAKSAVFWLNHRKTNVIEASLVLISITPDFMLITASYSMVL